MHYALKLLKLITYRESIVPTHGITWGKPLATNARPNYQIKLKLIENYPICSFIEWMAL